MSDVNDGLETFDSLMQQGLIASAADQGTQAIALFKQAAALAPAAGMPHFLIGAEHAALENFAEAEVAFSDAIALAPAMAIARYQLGLLQFSLVRIEVALRTWKPLLEMPEPNPYIGFIHGFAALAQDESVKAEAYFREGLAKNLAFQEVCQADGQAGVISRMLSEALASDIERVLSGLADDERFDAADTDTDADADGSSARAAVDRAPPKSPRTDMGRTDQTAGAAQNTTQSPSADHFLLNNYSPQGRPN